MLGFQFLATIEARLAGNKDANFLPAGAAPEPERKLISLDATESYFKALAAAKKKR
jgi:hypothetical protein